MDDVPDQARELLENYLVLQAAVAWAVAAAPAEPSPADAHHQA